MVGRMRPGCSFRIHGWLCDERNEGEGAYTRVVSLKSILGLKFGWGINFIFHVESDISRRGLIVFLQKEMSEKVEMLVREAYDRMVVKRNKNTFEKESNWVVIKEIWSERTCFISCSLTAVSRPFDIVKALHAFTYCIASKKRKRTERVWRKR